MAVDRDLAVAVVRALRALGSELRTGWEMTAATGVRGVRLVREAGPFDCFTLTETHPEAFAVLRENSRALAGLRPLLHDAREVPPEPSEFDYVDLDPYGTPVPFVPAAFSSVRTGGLLAVTATDMMVLAGAQPAVCRERYGAAPVRGRLGTEGGLRILLAYLAREARALHRRIVPRLGYVGEHHVRAYVSVPAADASADPIAPIDPAEWPGPPVGGRGPLGPLWLGPLFDPVLVRALTVPPAAERKRELTALLDRFREESLVDVPFYFEANTLARSLHLPRPPPLASLLPALRARGFRAARTHVRPGGFRTNAPRARVEEIVRSGSLGQSQNARVRA